MGAVWYGTGWVSNATASAHGGAKRQSEHGCGGAGSVLGLEGCLFVLL